MKVRYSYHWAIINFKIAFLTFKTLKPLSDPLTCSIYFSSTRLHDFSAPVTTVY